MQNKIKELELDLNELKFLLEETKNRPEFVAITKRHITRLIGSLEELQKDLEQIQRPVPVDHGEAFAVEPQERELLVGVVEPEIRPEKKEPDTTAPPVPVFGDQLKPSVELVKSISLNDTFRFSRELFDGDMERMNRTLQEITQMNTLADAISYISSRAIWDEENEATKDFIELLRKYFV